MEFVRMTHPSLPAGQVATAPRSAYDDVWRHRDWIIADDAPDVDGLTVSEVLDMVGDDPAQAALALDAERGSRNRSTLVGQLERIASGTTFDPSNDNEE